MTRRTSKRRTSARRSSRGLRRNAPERIRLGDKVRYAGYEWDVDDIQAYDHLHGGEPKTLVLRRTVVIDPKRQFLNEAVFKRNVPASGVEPLRTMSPNGPGRYLLVRDLPRSLQAALREVEYGKKDIEVKAREHFDPSAAGGGGRRGFVAACKMDDSGTYEIEWGSWGGENPFTKTVEGFQGEVPIPPEVAFIRGSIGGGIPTMASVYVSPRAMNPALLTAGPEVTPKEAKILAIFKGLKSSYRPEYLDRLEEKENELASSRERKAAIDSAVESLVERGFLSRNKAGSISITTEGRNAADPRQP